MKHYYSFLVLSLFVFLSLVCPSPVMAECTNTLALDIESDRVIPSSCPTGAPSGLRWNHNYYGVGEDDYFWDWKGTTGELYYKITLNGATTCTFSISLANSQKAWMNIYSAGTGSDQCVVGGETYHKSSYHDLNGHNYSGSFNTETVSSVSLSEGTYIISIYGENYTSMQSISITASDNVFCEPSCTVPDHVDISGNWDYFGGEDISLTATAYSSAGTESPIADANITGWQWQKWYNDRWNDVTDGTDGDATISGATTKNLQIANCSKNNSGSYQCVVSTGATCSTSGSEVVKVFTLECYNGGTTVYNFTRVGDTQSGTLELELNANTDYEFKFHVDTKFYGHNGHITADATNVVCYEKYNNADAPNITIKTGVEGGTFIIGMEYSTGGNNSNEGEPEISVTYPRKKIYFNPGGSTYWDQGGAQFALYYQRNSGENSGWTDIMSPFTCDGDVYSADIPLWHGVAINCVRLNSSATNNNKASWWTSYKWNQTANITLSASYNKYTITGWGASEGADCPYSSSTYSPTTYTISFAGNGSDGGTNMTNVSSIACDGEVTLVANTWTKTGHSFSGWKTNVAVTADGSPVAANGIVSDEATISNITSDITLTAQWTPNPHTLTWVLDGGTVTTAGTQADVDVTGSPSGTVNYGETVTAPTVTKTGYNFSAWSPAVVSPMPDADKTYMATWTIKTTTITIDDNDENHGSTSSSVTATWGSALPSFTAASGVAGYGLIGYYTGATDGTKIINADGTLVRNTTYATDEDTPKWKYEGGSVTLYPQYDLIICQSSRTYQVEDIMITTAGAVTDHDMQATPSNVKIITSENQDYDANTDDYFASISDGAFVYNTQARSAVYMEVDVPSAGNYTLDVYSGKGQDKNVWVNVYTTTSGSGDHISYGGTTYYKQYNTQLNKDYSTYAIKLSDKNDGTGVGNKEYPAGKCIIGIYTGSANCALDKIVLTRVDDSEVFCKHTITVNNTSGASSSAIADKSKALSGETVTVTAYAASDGYRFTGWTATSGTVTFANASSLSTTFVMPDEDVTLTANYALDELTISSLPWAGDQDLTGQTVVSAEAISSCFDSEITFTFTGTGTVNYYDNNDRETSLGTVSSGTAIILDGNLRAHGIYIRCTEGEANLTAVSKTTIGSVYQIWSAAGSTLGAVEVGYWSQQVVLGPEHFQTAIVGDVLRVKTSDEGGDAQGALQYILTNGDSHTYKGLDNYTDGGLHNWDLSDEQKSQHYFEITINATHLANLKRYGAIVKGRYYTIQSVELRASCSNQAMRTSAPDVTIHGADGSIDIMTNKLEFEGEGFNLGNWEHKLELDEHCFNSVTVGSIINFYMKVEDGATLSFRCNVDSVHAKSYGEPPLCPSYGDISFDRTIDDLYGDAPTLIGRIKGYKVLYLLVDADMLRRLKETGMILCGKGTLIKVVEGVPETVVVNPGEEKKVPTVVNNLIIHQGGEVTNDEDIEVLGKITYIRPAKDGELGNRLDQWYTFALPFTVSDVEVYDEADKKWYDINAVYYSSDETDQAANDPNGAGHYYLQYLKAENETVPGAFAARWQYITPGHSLACVSEYVANNGTRYGYPKKDEAYIILFDSEQPIGPYFETNTQVRFVGVGPQTIDGVAKEWKVEADGEQYWMYANNTLHSFTLTDAYILNEAGTYFELQTAPDIRPFECYVQATESLKTRYAAIPMRGFHIDNTPTGAESIQGSAIRAEKILRNGQLIIIRNGVAYDATGVVIR